MPLFVTAIDHVQLAMPAGRENEARTFYIDGLGFREVLKPTRLAARGGVWFASGTLRLHLGVDRDFKPAAKAHPAFLVHDLTALRDHLASVGIRATIDEPLEGYDRIYVADPFGNRIELMEQMANRLSEESATAGEADA